MYQHLNNAWGFVAPGFTRSVGGGTIALRPGDGAKFGAPSPESPIRLSIHRKNPAPTSDLDRYLSIVVLRCEGRTDDDLAVTVPIEGFADAAVLPGDLVTCEVTAGDLADLGGRIIALEEAGSLSSVGLSMPGGFGVVGSPLTVDGTISVTTALSGLVKASGGAFVEAIPSVDYATPADLEAIELTPGPPGVGSFGLSMPSGFVVANSPLTDSGTIAVSITLTGILKGDGSGFGVAIPGTDYATPAAVATKADDSAVVHLAGVETITGAKSFTGSAAVKGGLSILNSVGAEAFGFDADGFGAPGPIRFLFARSVDLVAATGLVQGGLAPFAGRIAKVLVRARTNGASGGFSVQIKKNGSTSLFASPYSVAASDTATKTITSFAADSLAAGDWFSFDFSAVGAGVQEVEILIVPLTGNR